MFRISQDETLTADSLGIFIAKHKKAVDRRYRPLQDAYKTNYDIFRAKNKPDWKPDNRIAVNFAKYITDTMNGFFIGNPIRITSDDQKVNDYVNLLDQYNDQDDNNAELSKACSIYGKAYEMYYVDIDGNIGITYLTPLDAFMIFDDSILQNPRYFVRTYIDSKNVLHGSVSDESTIRYFTKKGQIVFDAEEKPHGFDGVPASLYRENAEEMGIFEPVLTPINAYNKAISEKANDVDYFADCYMKVLGPHLEQADLQQIRSNRIVNMEGDAASGIVVEFMAKPDADTTQEHLIDRLEKLIFQISMVANISDENFGSSTGIALKYKLQSMSNLAKTKERKFTSGMNRRYKLIFSNPVSGMKKDDWVKISYKFTPNIPSNQLEESEIAKNLEGIVPKETQLKALSIVDNVQETVDKLKEEQSQTTTLPDNLFTKTS